MPCHVMCSEPGLKKGHTTGLVNCYWAILGPQRVVRRPACLPLPTTASGSLADTRSLPWLSLCTFWTRGAGRGRARQDLSAAAPPCHWLEKLSSSLLKAEAAAISPAIPSEGHTQRWELKQNACILSTYVIPVTSTQHLVPILTPLSLSSKTGIIVIEGQLRQCTQRWEGTCPRPHSQAEVELGFYRGSTGRQSSSHPSAAPTWVTPGPAQGGVQW